MKRTMKRVLTMVLVLAALVSTQLVTASAAAVTKAYNSDKTVTMTIKTGSKAGSIKLVCNATKETLTVNRPLLGKKTYKHSCSAAPKMVLDVQPRVNGVRYFYLQGLGRSISSTLKLDKNTTYTVKVSYYRNPCNLCRCSTTDLGLFHDGEAVGSPRYYCNGSWYVASSKNIKKITVR